MDTLKVGIDFVLMQFTMELIPFGNKWCAFKIQLPRAKGEAEEYHKAYWAARSELVVFSSAVLSGEPNVRNKAHSYKPFSMEELK